MRMDLITYISVFVVLMAKPVIAREDVTVLASYTNTNAPGIQWFLRSAKIYGIKIENLAEWKEFKKNQKNILWRKLEVLKNRKLKDHIVLLVHSHDVIFQAGLDEIVKRFKKFSETRILFAAKHYCLPERNMAKFYPPNKHFSSFYPYLNSGGIIGYLNDIFSMIHYMRIFDHDLDDQLAFTKIYLKDSLRKNFKISLDSNATIFQNLAHSQAHIELEEIDDEIKLINTKTGQRPLIIHGDGDEGKQLMRMLSPFLLGNESRDGMSPRLLDSILRKFRQKAKTTGPSDQTSISTSAKTGLPDQNSISTSVKTGPPDQNSIFTSVKTGPPDQNSISTSATTILQLFHPASKENNNWPAPFSPVRTRFRTTFPQDHWQKNNFFTHVDETSKVIFE